jgi:hypothetical protein
MPRAIQYSDNGFQESRTIIHAVDGQEERVASADILTHVLRVPIDRQTTSHNIRIAQIMKRLGWERTSNGKVNIFGRGQVRGYFRRGDGALPLPKPG